MPSPLLQTVLQHLNDLSTTKKYVGLALAVKLLREENGESNPNRHQNRAVVVVVEEEEEEEDTTNTDEEDVFLSVCHAAMKDDFLLSLISPSLSGGDGDGCSTQKRMKVNHPENMQRRSLGINVCASLASGSRDCALSLLPIAEELNTNADITLPRDSVMKLCEFMDRTCAAVVHIDDSSEGDNKKREGNPLQIVPKCVERVLIVLEDALASDGNKGGNDIDGDAILASAILALCNIITEIRRANKNNIFVFDPYGDLDDYDSDDEFMNPYVSTAELISSDYKMIGVVVKECLYKRAGTEAALMALEFLNAMIESRILGENDDSAKHRYRKSCWKDFETGWAKELSEGLKFILSSKSVDKRQRALAVHVAASVQFLCGDDWWMLKKSSIRKTKTAGPAAAAAENASNITLFEIVSQIGRVEMEVEIYHLLESDDNATRYKASENLSRSLHSFRTLVQVFTLAFGEEEEEGEDNIGDISKGFENLDISAEGAMKQLNVIVAVIGSLLEIIGSARNIERLDDCGADPFLVFEIADIVGRFANDLEVVHVGEIDASMKHIAENMRKRIAQIGGKYSEKYDILQYGWDRMESIVYNFNVRIWSTYDAAYDPERLECQINSGFISLLFEMVAENVSTKCDSCFDHKFDSHMKFLEWVEKYAHSLANDMSRMLVEGWPERLRALSLDYIEIERIKKQWVNLTEAVQNGKASIDDRVKGPSKSEPEWKETIEITKKLLPLFEDLDDPKRLDVCVVR